LSSFDQEYARYQDENSPRDWSVPEVNVGKERQLFSMQELFRNLIVSDDASPYRAIHNDIFTETFLDPIMNTFLDAEMNDNNKTSMIYHKDKHGRYSYDRTNPIDIMFPGALHENAMENSSMANWADSVNVFLTNPDGSSTSKNIKARMFIDQNGEPVMNITKDGVPQAKKAYVVEEDSGLAFLDNNFFIVFIFLLSIIGMAFTSPEWIIVNSVLTMFIAGALFLLNGVNFVVGLGGLMWLVVGAGILIMKIAKQEDK
jgi:hypothetical protein